MLRTRLILVSLVFAGAALSAVAMRDSHQEQPQPAEQHRAILQGAGSWEGTMKMWMPGMPEQTTACKEENVAFGQFWLKSTFECDFMGMPYKGQGVTGYDPMKQKYVGTWYDNMSPFLAVMEGEEAAGGKLIMRWQGPTMDGSIQPHRFEMVHGNDSYTSTFYVGEGATEHKSMEMNMKRKGAAAAK